MKRLLMLGSGLTLTLALIGCNPPETPSTSTTVSSTKDTREADMKAIHDDETQWNKDLGAKDVAASTSHYADDAVLMLPYAAPSVGRDAIQKYIQKLLSDPALQVHFQSTKLDVASSGDFAYARGTYKMVFTDEMVKKPVNDHGAYVAVYHKQPDGSWKVIENIVNSEQVNAPTRQMFPGTH